MQKENILQEIGLTKQETRTYLGLVELGETKTGRLCKHIGIASSNIYRILDSLVKQGLATYRLQNNIKIYSATSPEALQDMFEQKRQRLEQKESVLKDAISSLKEKERQDLSYSNYKYFEGLQGVKSMWREINDLISSKHPIKIHTGTRDSYKKLVPFLDEHQRIRAEKNVYEQMIFPKEDKKLAEERSEDLVDIRFMPLRNEAEWGVFGETLYMHHITGTPPRGFLIHDEKFAETFRHVFEQLWEKSSQQ